MEVFVLMGEIDYEADLLLGVYASEQEAIDAHGVYTRDGDRFIDAYYIVRQVVGAPAEHDFDERQYI